MIPRVDDSLRAFAEELADVGPTIEPSYRGAIVSYIGSLLNTAAEWWDEAAHLLIEENRALRKLFGEIAPLIADAALREALEAHSAAVDENFRISALQDVNEAMRAALIEAHAAIEDLDGARAREAEDAIWQELRRSTDRRRTTTSLYYG